MSTASSDSKEAKSGKRKAEHFIKRKSFLRELWIYIWQSLVDLWQWGTWGDAYRFQARLQMLMEFTDDLMKKHGMGREYWVDYGCLLGAVRHQRLILWDHDLDIGVTTKCYNKMMELMRAKEPLPEGYEWYYNEESQYLQIWQGGDIWVDIVQYGYNAEKRELQPILKDYYTKDPENREEYCPPIQEEFVLPLGTGRLWKREYPIPADPDSYLRIVYGDYWTMRRIPLLITFLYHPILTTQFYLHYRKQRKLFKAAAKKAAKAA